MPRLQDIQVGNSLGSRTFEPSNVSLFLYNAAIWNPHRIHFDEPYATQVEKHAGIVVDGPLQGDWLSQVVTDWAGNYGELVELEYSNRRAAFVGECLHTGGTVTAVDQATGHVEVDIHLKNTAGEVIAPGRALVQFHD